MLLQSVDQFFFQEDVKEERNFFRKKRHDKIPKILEFFGFFVMPVFKFVFEIKKYNTNAGS